VKAIPQVGTNRWVLWCGVIGPILFVATFLVEGATRQDYDPARVFVSQLSLGDLGWLQIANFVVSGSLIALFAIGLHAALLSGSESRWGPILVAAVGLGLVVAGVFVTDPALGYPPGTSSGLTPQPSWHGSIHLLGALLVFGGLPIACFLFSRRFRASGDGTWATYSAVSGIAMFGALLALRYADRPMSLSVPQGDPASGLTTQVDRWSTCSRSRAA
jgi:hypothetical protein